MIDHFNKTKQNKRKIKKKKFHIWQLPAVLFTAVGVAVGRRGPLRNAPEKVNMNRNMYTMVMANSM